MENHPLAAYTGGFNNGLDQVRRCDFNSIRIEIWQVLNINNHTSYAYYRKGISELRPSQIIAIEAIFNKYGVNKNIWGSR